MTTVELSSEGFLLTADKWRERLMQHGFTVACKSARIGSDWNAKEVSLEGVNLEELLQEFGSPLVVVHERLALESVKGFRDITSALEGTLRPQLRVASRPPKLSPSLVYSSAAQVYASVSAHPTMELLRRLSNWEMGLVAQSAGEVVRALRAGVAAHSILFSSSFKTEAEMLQAHKQGLLAIEVESLPEFEELLGPVFQQAAETAGYPVRICLRLGIGKRTQLDSLSLDQALYLCGRLRTCSHLSLVGISSAWGRCEETDIENFKVVVHTLRSFVEEQLSAGFPIEFAMIGARSKLNLQTPEEAPEQCNPRNYSRVTFQAFRGASFRVYFSCADAIFRQSTHLLGTVVRIAESPERITCYLDIAVPGHTSDVTSVLPLSGHTLERSAFCTRTTTLKQRVVVGRSCLDHMPVYLSAAPFELRAGMNVLLPAVGAGFCPQASQAGSVLRPTEVLITAEGEVVVLRRRDTLESCLGVET